MINPNDNLRRLLLALHALVRNTRAVAALQALVAGNTLLTLFLFGQDYFGWWRPLPPAVDAALVGLMTSLSLTLCGFLAFVASLYFIWQGRAPARPQPRSRTLRAALFPFLYGLPALWGRAYLTGGDPRPWGSLAVAFAAVYYVFGTGLLAAEKFQELRAEGSTAPTTGPVAPARTRTARPGVRGFLWRQWWLLTHPGYLSRLSPLDRSLYVAVGRGDVRSVGAYLTRGANPNLRLVYDTPLLRFAVTRGHAEIVRLLLEAGAETEAANSNTGVTPLHSAAMSDDLAVVRLLLEHGAAVDAHSRYGVTALALAARRNRVEMIRLLLTHGAHVNGCSNSGSTALMTAASAGHAEAIQVLLEAGADTSLKNSKGLTALDFARRRRQTEVITLLEAGMTRKVSENAR